MLVGHVGEVLLVDPVNEKAWLFPVIPKCSGAHKKELLFSDRLSFEKLHKIGKLTALY